MRTRHLLQLVLLSALWGASFLFIRIASPALGPHVAAALRIGLATLTLVAIMRATREPWPWRHWRELAGLGTLTVALPFLLYAYAALHLPAGYSALLNTMVVPFGVLASAWMKRATTRMSPLSIAAGIHAAALVLLLPGAAWSLPQARFTPLALAAVAVMGIVTSGLAYWLNLRVLSQVSPVAAMSSAFMIPLFGVAWGHIFLGEALGPGMLWGGALVLLATSLVTGFNPLRLLAFLRPR